MDPSVDNALVLVLGSCGPGDSGEGMRWIVASAVLLIGWAALMAASAAWAMKSRRTHAPEEDRDGKV